MTSLISHTTYLRLPYEKNLRSQLRLAFYLQLVCRSHGIPPADRVKEFAVTMNFGFPSPETHLVPMPKKPNQVWQPHNFHHGKRDGSGQPTAERYVIKSQRQVQLYF
jgi:hypothetical protein